MFNYFGEYFFLFFHYFFLMKRIIDFATLNLILVDKNTIQLASQLKKKRP